jgi:hypothetical protein
VNLLTKSPRAFVEMMGTPVRYDTANTEELMAGTDITCPAFESYVDAVVEYVKKRVQERKIKSEIDREANIEDALL